ncbi:MAG: hypothetical protein HYX74_11070 [Acidobacteria bacterium]|nr:hypothetical protein [Acidobacteriota bacterium]
MLGYVLLAILPMTASTLAHTFRTSRAAGALIALATLASLFVVVGGVFPAAQVADIPLSFDPFSRLAFTSYLVLAALAVVYGWLVGENQRLFAAGLAVTGFLGLMLSLATDLQSAALVFVLGALFGAFGIGLRPDDVSLRYAPLRFICYSAVAGMSLLGAFALANRFEVTRDPEVAQDAFAFQSVFTLVALGVFPFNLWFPRAPERGGLMMVAILAAGSSIGGLWLFVETYASFPWLTLNTQQIGVLVALATFGSLGASLIAATRLRLDYLVVYSFASNTGLVVAGLALGTPLSVAGGIVTLLNSLWAVFLLFMCLGIVRVNGEPGQPGAGVHSTLTTWLGVCVGGLALSGLPPTAGFYGRWMIYEAMSSQPWHLVFSQIASSALVFLGFARVLRDVWVNDERSAAREDEPVVPSSMAVALAILILAVGVYPTPILQTVADAIAGALPSQSM